MKSIGRWTEKDVERNGEVRRAGRQMVEAGVCIKYSPLGEVGGSIF